MGMLIKEIVDIIEKKLVLDAVTGLHGSYLSPRSTYIARVNMYVTLCNMVEAAPY
jgi:hypothetical protein